MAEINCQFGKNIRYLRTAYGETQLELAIAVGLESPNTIANYEKGERSPKPDIRKKIALHYRITEDELSHSDFSAFHVSSSQLGDKEKMMEMTLLMFPIICTEKAMKDSLFQKGHEAHMRALDAMKEGRAFAESDYDTCVNAYSDSYDTSETPESVANLLWWFLISEMSVKNRWMIEGAKALNDKRVSNEAFFKSFYLKDYSINEEEDCLEDVEQNDLEELDQAIIELLKELKKDVQYSSLADYYTALRYVLGCVNNELTEAMNMAVGAEMMWAFTQLGNEYAMKFILQGIENSRK
ncbi:helix-turn-helix transcriptional regulator [Fredinandcohnia sp. QZ13]|uniref:helix-turn-helix domain-containing protein n=1 Tax=Fredinandcohnia sp. QZ13 TaxID=3073144 RepID=UPI0028531FF1|nr:helix-turn-helix transcriptional regulator [Fredinandcohnia sp. QZ13]MDR4888226.1 helix-turn-helix transcriptional regulator [Fredinandcohnia sp. QZ13]